MLVEIDRDKAASLGISAKAIETALWSAYGSRQISNIYAPTDTYRVIIEVAPEFQRRPDLLSKLYVQPDMDTGSSRTPVPLDGRVRITEGAGPITVNLV